MTKKIVNVTVGTPRVYQGQGGDRPVIFAECTFYFDDSLDTIMAALQAAKDKYSCDYTDLSIESRSDCGCRHNCSCSPSYVLCGKRLETDIEYDFRINEEARFKAQQDERERREYEALKKKFGK